MAIAVDCPSCHSKMRAPDNLAGRKAKCPKCGQLIAVPAAIQSAPAPAVPASPPTSIAAMPAGIPPISLASSSRNSEEDGSSAPHRPQPDISRGGAAAHSLGIGSMVLGVVALVLSFIPRMGMFSMPLSGLGLLLGIIGGVVALRRSGRGIGFPIAGSAISGVTLLIALFWLGLANVTHKTLDQSIETNATDQIIESGSEGKKTSPPPAIRESAPPEKPTPPNKKDSDWTDATKLLRQGDVRVGISSVSIDQVQFTGLLEQGLSKDKLLLIRLRIENVGQTRKIEYQSWGDTSHLIDRHTPLLRDNFNNTYHRVTFGFGTQVHGQLSSESIYPGKSVEDVLVFERPIDRINYLQLELPASAFGGTGQLRFRIPKGLIVDAMQQQEQAMRAVEAARQREAAQQQEAAQQRERAMREAAEKQAEENRQRQKMAEVEKHAWPLYQQAYKLWFNNHYAEAKKRCEEIIRKYPDTKSADKAKELLDKMRK